MCRNKLKWKDGQVKEEGRKRREKVRWKGRDGDGWDAREVVMWEG